MKKYYTIQQFVDSFYLQHSFDIKQVSRRSIGEFSIMSDGDHVGHGFLSTDMVYVFRDRLKRKYDNYFSGISPIETELKFVNVKTLLVKKFEFDYDKIKLLN